MSTPPPPAGTLSLAEKQARLRTVLAERIGRARTAPASFAQERLWFLDRMEPQSPFYNFPEALRIRGALDAPALERALGEVVRRHEVLRTTFREVDGAPVQVIAPFAGLALPVEELSALDAGEREAEARRRAAEAAARPFDLSTGPLFRAALLRLDGDDHVLLLSMHHVVTDGWSRAVLFGELSALYGAFRAGNESPLPEPAVQYADYAAWQRRTLRGEALDRHLAWWRERLAGAPELLELPTDRPRPAVQAYGGAFVPLELPRELADPLEALGRAEGATLFMVLLGAFQLLLGRYAGADDVVVGSSIAGRTRPELEPLIGLFINTLVLRTDLSGDPSFRALLRRVRQATLGAYEHQEAPFEKLVEALRPERSLSHSPLFQVSFDLHNTDTRTAALPGLEVFPLEGVLDTTKFDLSLDVAATPRGLSCGLTYATALFERATVERMAAHFRRVLEQVCAHPDARLSWLRLAGAEERARVVEEWNRTGRPFPREACVHHLFEAQAERTPDAVALAWDEVELSYRELDARANRLAHHLARLGVGPEARVGVLLERGVEMVVAVLAVLKAGGCCVPVDASYPAERIALMLDDASVRVLVSDGGLSAALERPGLHTVRLDAVGEALASEPAHAPQSGTCAGNLAYVFYTSGSTGRPKGVMMGHREVVQLAACIPHTMPLGPGDRVAQASNASFDAAVFELWGALLHGAALVGVERDVLLSAPALGRVLRERGITHLYQTAALFNQHVREQVDVYAGLRQLVFGAEAVGTESVRRMLRHGRPGRVLHEYGPTEATVWCTLEVVEEVARGAATVPIGRPVPNARSYVLDSALEPLPPGVPGELYVGGAGVVRGYLGRPALTAGRFVPDPFAAEPGARMYRTGDRARWTAEGKLEFMGRLDEQVKVRGFRIEPGEVESALCGYPGVRQARVVVREDVPGDKRLVAYVIGEAQGEALRAHLRRSLPEYMVPQAFVGLDRLPLTPNGKLDRKALPAPGDAAADERYEAPRTPVEEVLAGIWAAVLGRGRVGVHDGFFEAGGHSLLATRVVSRVRQVFEVELPLRALFERPTVAGLAEAVEALRRAGAPVLPPVVPTGRAGPLPLSFAQERVWFLDRLEPDSPLYNIPAALRLSGALDVPALERALGEVVRRHEALRTTFAEVDGVATQVVAPFAGFVLPMEDLPMEDLPAVDHAGREAAARRVAAMAARPFDLAAGPLFRAALLRLGAGEHVLLLEMHHAVSDGWSMGVLFRELSALYGAYREGRGSPLPALPVQYADYAAWQRGQLRGEALERQLAYWRGRLAGAPALLELPADHPRPAARTYRGAYEPVELAPALVERLEALGRREGATLYMVLLAAFQVLLSKYAGSGDVSVGSPIAGRTRREVEELIGLFVNTLVLRTDLSGDPTFRALLGRVREGTLGVWEHQELPFEKLVAELQPERSLGHSPLFQVLFTLQAAGAPAAALAGIAVEALGADAGTTKFDLTLFLAAGGGGLSGALGYSTDLFERGTARRLLGHLERLLEQVAGDAELRLSRLELLGGAERARVLEEWNRTAAHYPSDRCIHHLVEAQAERTPNAVALVDAGETLTYRELDRCANRLAHRLTALGVRPEEPVGLFLDAGIHGITGLLGIQKAGGAYVPLDVAAPDERTAFILDESRARAVVTLGGHAARPWAAGRTIVAMDHAGAFAGFPDTVPAPRAGAGSLAYVLYTSGSTGRPKGVLVEHGSVCNVATAFARLYRLGSGDRMLLLAPLHFDSSVAETFATLCSGAALHVPRGEAALPGDAQVEQLRRERITHAKFTPTALAALPFAALPELKVVAAGGEACPAELVARWRPGRRFLHTYGPTEATVRAACHECGDEPGRPPLGRPIANARLYVVDAALVALPAGVPGELVVGGVPVTRGYLGRPALTAERFVPDPFGVRPGARLYRTGDRARWRADGVVEFIGRFDDQVKIRGFRVEPGEVRAVLRRHPAVDDCAVVAREDAPGRKRLVAYVVGTADDDALRAHLRRELPEYMVPSAFVFLDRLPRTSNDKLDHGALPVPGHATAGDRHVPPRTAEEETLAAVWAEVLRLERVGVRENFFELGGDSILSIQVVSRARRAGLEVTPRQLFEHQTIAGLAAVAARGAAAAPRAEQGPAGGAVPLTPVQARFFEQGHAAPWHHNQGVLLAVDPALAGGTLEAALAAVLERHDALRLRFRRTHTGWEQVHADHAGIALERVDLSALPAHERDRAQDAAAQARQASLALERGPLGRAVLFDRGEEGRVLFLVLHHLVVDGVSWRIVREDLERASARLHAGEPVDLGARSTSFRAWAEALRAYAEGDAVREEAPYWLAQGPGGVAALPVDGTGEPAGGARTLTVALDEEETRALLREVPAAYRTQINDVLLCALAETVGGWTGSPRVRLALEGHGREEEIGDGVDLTRTVGWFTSVYPVVLDLAGAADAGERLMRVKEQLRGVPRRGIGYGVLRWLSPDAAVRGALAAQAEPEVSFNYLGQFDRGLALAEHFRFADGPRGRDSADANRRRYLLDVNGVIEGECLRLDWTYGEGTHRRETIEHVAGAYLAALRALIAHCRAAGAGGCTPSDFPLAGVTQAELQTAVAGRSVEDLYPLSPLQEGLLFHALYGGPQAYQVQAAHRLEGPLDADLLRRAWAEVASRHAVLRTSFVWHGLPRPLQRVEPAAAVPWRVEDWRGWPDEEQEAALERYLAADRARGFALGEAPLLRCALFRVDDQAHWLVCSRHHLLMDGWSSARVLDEVFRLVHAWSAGEAAEAGRARPYRDFIAWLLRRDPEAAERYWTGVLRGFGAPTPLGVDRAAAPDARVRYASRSLALSAARTRRLEKAARSRKVTLNTVLQGAWGLLLSRYGGERDVVFGAIVSGRPAELEGVEEMVGLFINTLPVRVRVHGGARVGEWLGELQRTQAQAREHEHAPLLQVQEWSEVPRGTPLFESLVVFENYPVEPGAGAEARLRLAESRSVEWSTYALTLAVAPGPELLLALGFDENRFDAGTIERMLEHLGRVLDQIAAEPDGSLAGVGLVGADERRLLVEEWNRTDRPFPRGVCIHDLFAAQVAERPDTPALVWGDTRLTYAELDARANRLAHHLARLGVGPEARAGVLLERGVELIVSLLAVLKAGGCYVPLDPGYPAERLKLMLADAGVRVLLTRRDLASPLTAPDVAIVCLDEAAEALSAEPSDAPRSAATPENLAYIVYTSGSTGRPKGVLVSHRNVVQLVRETDYVRLAPGDRVAQASSASFDALTFEAWGALLNGATLVGIDREVLLSPPALRETLREQGITTLYQTTALLNQLSREQPDIFAPLREVLFGGQAADADSVRRILKAGKPKRLLHMYGPTETTAWCSWEQVESLAEDALTVSVGRPTGNQRIYLLHSALHPAPVGVPGEAYVGGAGVVRGYLDRPGLTAERFVPDPFADEPGARMYRTGDRLRWKTNGALEFVGRLDDQVKIRGFRIEPGEVESALCSHPAVREARVVVREDEPGEKRLVAYVVGEAGADDLRAHLRQSLPEYMLPAAFVVQDALPLTAVGKLDVKALPAPELAPADRYVTPRTPVEEALAEIWAEVLGAERVGVDDDFFALGGHSLRVIRVVSRVQAIFGFELPLRTVFDAPTVARLAALLAGDPRWAAGTERVSALMLKVREMSSGATD